MPRGVYKRKAEKIKVVTLDDGAADELRVLKATLEQAHKDGAAKDVLISRLRRKLNAIRESVILLATE